MGSCVRLDVFQIGPAVRGVADIVLAATVRPEFQIGVRRKSLKLLL